MTRWPRRAAWSILRGNIAPEGAIAKVTGHTMRTFAGTARVFDDEDGALEAVLHGSIKPGDVVVIRYEGPRRRPRHAGDALGHSRPSSARAGGSRSPW